MKYLLLAFALVATPVLAMGQYYVGQGNRPVAQWQMDAVTQEHAAATAAVKRYLDANPQFANSPGRIAELDPVTKAYEASIRAFNLTNAEAFGKYSGMMTTAITKLCARIRTCQ